MSAHRKKNGEEGGADRKLEASTSFEGDAVVGGDEEVCVWWT